MEIHHWIWIAILAIHCWIVCVSTRCWLEERARKHSWYWCINTADIENWSCIKYSESICIVKSIFLTVVIYLKSNFALLTLKQNWKKKKGYYKETDQKPQPQSFPWEWSIKGCHHLMSALSKIGKYRLKYLNDFFSLTTSPICFEGTAFSQLKAIKIFQNLKF